MTFVKVNNPLTKTFDGMMKDLFNDFPSTVNKTVREDVLHFPPVNIHENESMYLLELAAPGFEKTDFKITLDVNVLSVTTEKQAQESGNTDKIIRSEFSKKSFKRSFTLDEKIEAEKINARYENGILLLELPKKEIIKNEKKEIQIQ